MSAFVLRGDITDADPGVRLYFGQPGSGKSYALKESVKAGAASRIVFVVDYTREWANDKGELLFNPGGLPVIGSRTVQRCVDLIETMTHGIVVFHPRVWIEDTTALVSCLTIRGEQPKRVGVAISEAHNIAPNGQPLSPGFDALVTRWRHLQIAAWLDTQRPARIARTVTELATLVCQFSANGPRDADAAAELTGKAPEFYEAIEEVNRRFATGDNGWHVRLGLNRSPPYELVKV